MFTQDKSHEPIKYCWKVGCQTRPLCFTLLISQAKDTNARKVNFCNSILTKFRFPRPHLRSITVSLENKRWLVQQYRWHWNLRIGPLEMRTKTYFLLESRVTCLARADVFCPSFLCLVDVTRDWLAVYLSRLMGRLMGCHTNEISWIARHPNKLEERNEPISACQCRWPRKAHQREMNQLEHFLTDRREVWKCIFRIWMFHVGYTNMCPVILQGIYMSCEKCNRSMFEIYDNPKCSRDFSILSGILSDSKMGIHIVLKSMTLCFQERQRQKKLHGFIFLECKLKRTSFKTSDCL